MHPRFSLERDLDHADVSPQVRMTGLVIAKVLGSNGRGWAGEKYFLRFGIGRKRRKAGEAAIARIGAIQAYPRRGPSGSTVYVYTGPIAASAGSLRNELADSSAGSLGNELSDLSTTTAAGQLVPGDQSARSLGNDEQTNRPSSSSSSCEGKVQLACKRIAARQLAAYNKPIGNLASTTMKFEETARSNYGAALTMLCEDDPTVTVDQLVQAVLDDGLPKPEPRWRCPSCSYVGRPPCPLHEVELSRSDALRSHRAEPFTPAEPEIVALALKKARAALNRGAS